MCGFYELVKRSILNNYKMIKYQCAAFSLVGGRCFLPQALSTVIWWYKRWVRQKSSPSQTCWVSGFCLRHLNRQLCSNVAGTRRARGGGGVGGLCVWERGRWIIWRGKVLIRLFGWYGSLGHLQNFRMCPGTLWGVWNHSKGLIFACQGIYPRIQLTRRF